MSTDYSILFDSYEPTDVVKSQLERVTGTPFILNEDRENFDRYYTQVLGLELGFYDYRERIKQVFGDIPRYSFKLSIHYIRDKTGLGGGKQWQSIAVVELARMISRNLNCVSIVTMNGGVINKFELGDEKEFDANIENDF